MIKSRQVTITERYAVCDFCGAEMKWNRCDSVIETCSHCGKHICEKHWDNECEFGEGEDTWCLCPECVKLVDICEKHEEPLTPIMKDTGKEMELPYW